MQNIPGFPRHKNKASLIMLTKITIFLQREETSTGVGQVSTATNGEEHERELKMRMLVRTEYAGTLLM
jgi:hypothetical protein